MRPPCQHRSCILPTAAQSKVLSKVATRSSAGSAHGSVYQGVAHHDSEPAGRRSARATIANPRHTQAAAAPLSRRCSRSRAGRPRQRRCLAAGRIVPLPPVPVLRAVNGPAASHRAVSRSLPAEPRA